MGTPLQIDKDQPGRWGASHTLALVMSAIDIDVVHRSTLRALLPNRGPSAPSPRKVHVGRAGNPIVVYGNGSLGSKGTWKSGSRGDRMSMAFEKALRRFEQAGWIVRGAEYVLIKNRRALTDWSGAAQARPDIVFDAQAAIDQINEDLAANSELPAKAVEQRRRELLALKRLMENGFGSNWSGRGSVRLMPRGGVF